MMMDPKFVGKPITAQYQPGRSDLDQMPDTPNRRAHHRRAQSETFFRFSDVDDLLFDDVVMAPDFGLDLPADNAPMAVDSSKSESSNGPDNSSRQNNRPVEPAPSHHFRSLSVDDGFFEGLNFASSGAAAPPDCGETDRFSGKPAAAAGVGVGGGLHRHSNSMDGASMASFEVDSAKKAMAAEKLAELALIDPKRAKRILANRQSAARSKERKIRYTSELERKVQTLQTEATTLSAQVTLLQRDTTGLTAENKELKLRLQAMEQQAHLRDALNEALREEVQRLKIEAGQIPAANGNNFNRALPPQFSAHSQNFHHFGNQPSQQHHVLPTTTTSQSLSGQTQPSFLDFNQRT